jgi:ketosteroid isomerase-like protein
MQMMKRVAMMVALAAMCAPVLAEAGVEEDVIAMTYTQWKADMAKDTEGAMAIVADDYTEFNAQVPTRIDGKKMAMKMADAANRGDGELVMAEMVNPKVQVYGDTAILTYNFVGMMLVDGETAPYLAKSTRVYAKVNGDWKLVHANFAPVAGGDDD